MKPSDTLGLWNWEEAPEEAKAMPENNDKTMPARPRGRSTCLRHGLLKDLCDSQDYTQSDTSSSWHMMGIQKPLTKNE